MGVVEEACKALCLFGAAKGDRALDEPFDWVVYSVSVALGFAALENVRVLWQGAQAGWSGSHRPQDTSILRATVGARNAAARAAWEATGPGRRLRLPPSACARGILGAPMIFTMDEV